MNYFKKYPFVTTILLISVFLFIYGMLLTAGVVKASNTVNLSNDPETVGVATAVQDIKARLGNWIEGIKERDYSIDYSPTEYVPDEDIIEAFGVDDGEHLTAEEKAAKKKQEEQDAEAEARRKERSERMKNGEADEVIREAMKTVLDPNDASTPGDTYDGFYSVTDDYFNGGDTVIIGDSREQGFGLYSGYNVVNYAQKSYGVHQVFTKKWIDSEFGKLTLEEAMAARQGQFKKIYIKFGLNEMGWADEATFDNAYYQLIDMLKYYQPDAVIYVQSIINVTKEKSEESSVFTNQKINERNEALKKVAENEHVAYLDLNSVFADEEGCLPADYAADGIHIKQGYMNIWVDFLKKHAVISGDKDEAYIEGKSTYEPSDDSEDQEDSEEDDEDDEDEDEDEDSEDDEEPSSSEDITATQAQPAPSATPAQSAQPAASGGTSTGTSSGGWETGDDIK